jgi:hypothetical protein
MALSQCLFEGHAPTASPHCCRHCGMASNVVALVRVQSQPLRHEDWPRQSAPSHVQSLPSQAPAEPQRPLLQSLFELHESPSAAEEEEQVTRAVRATIETPARAALHPCLGSIGDTLAPAGVSFHEAVLSGTALKKGKNSPRGP